ncbi:protein ALTERED PHOSPHATE STARVATION RESPONSE 1 [Rosa rugosa]|uniref:protein ALTERED PHOSPHATE STARVATION RESPONSE 1 n=1 Tax=Rosa rugosa TaxID=74645 RepID=UPI002B40F231|nr:protein ALTERED PHOSPHATE STARVATION RESPONSE 1 [Rosa rugosa]
MGIANSKSEKDAALCLCRERKRFIKQAIDSRYALAASHVSYTNSLRSIGIALRRYAEAEVLIESSLSTSDKTPSHSSYPSPSPSPKISGSPMHNERPISPPGVATLSYMRSGGGSAAVTMRFNPVNSSRYVDEEIPLPPPPPPLLGEAEADSSWDYFDPVDAEESESFRFVGSSGVDVNCDDVKGWRQMRSEEGNYSVGESRGRWAKAGSNELDEGTKFLEQRNCEDSGDLTQNESEEHNANTLSSGGVDGGSRQLVVGQRNANGDSKREKSVGEKDLCDEREDPSDFITHRAKDFLSSIKDIDNRFLKASESGREVSRMLESNKIRVGYSVAKGRSSGLALLGTFQLVCCQGKTSLVSSEPEHVTKVITWKRTTSSRSSSSRNPLATASKDDADDSGSDFIEEFCMIAGSHSSTLDRLYAWERKLYDEVKASESIRKVYDVKCDQLRNQFAKDCSSQIIDKTRATVKDLHSRIRVALHAVDSISKRIEKMRDDELLPQLLELNQGLTRMWKAMLECHHAQYITISLAYHSKSSTVTSQGDTRRNIMAQLLEEIECFGLSFANWINSLTSYVEALNGWLQHCIMQPQERSKSRRPFSFSPRRAIAPPIFVLFRDWAAGIRGLPSTEVTDAVRTFLSDLRHMMEQASTQKRQRAADANNGESENKDDEENKEDENCEESSSNLSCIHSSLTKVLDRLTKFSEASLKMYEDIRQKSEAARNAYSNFNRPNRH